MLETFESSFALAYDSYMSVLIHFDFLSSFVGLIQCLIANDRPLRAIRC